MTRWLSDEWFETTRALAVDLQGPPELSARVQVVVTGGPDGDVPSLCELAGGRLASCAPGRIGDPEVTLTVGWEDGRALANGELDPGAAFMQGRMKITGSMAVLLDLLDATATPAYRELRRLVAESTDDWIT